MLKNIFNAFYEKKKKKIWVIFPPKIQKKKKMKLCIYIFTVKEKSVENW